MHDADDNPRLANLENLSQLTREGERIERGNPLREIRARISLEREWDRNSQEVINLIGELASPDREFPYPHPNDELSRYDYYGEGASDNFLPESPF